MSTYNTTQNSQVETADLFRYLNEFIAVGDKVELMLADQSTCLVQKIGINSKGMPTFKHIENGKLVGSASELYLDYIFTATKIS